jgi:hypothetical protein
MRYAAVLALGLVALAGCGGSGSTSTATTTTTMTQPKPAPATATTPKPAPRGGTSRVEEIENELRIARESMARKITPAIRQHFEREISKLERERGEARGR